MDRLLISKENAIIAILNFGFRLSREFEDRLESNKKAREYFNAPAPSSRKMSIGRGMHEKKEETRLRRIEILIQFTEKGQKAPPIIMDRRRRN